MRGNQLPVFATRGQCYKTIFNLINAELSTLLFVGLNTVVI